MNKTDATSGPVVPGLGDLKARAGDLLASGQKAGVLFELKASPNRHEGLQVVSFRGQEAISELFDIEVLLSSPWPDEPLEQEMEEKLLGQAAYLTIHGPEQEGRVVYGMVAAFELEASTPELGRPCVRVNLVPKLWLATQRKRTRIFQNQTVRQVVDAVLDEWKVRHQWWVMEDWAPRAYCTQYDETDYEFIRRLLAEEGLFFFFEPPADPNADDAQEELILCDHERVYAPILDEDGRKPTAEGHEKPPSPRLYVRSEQHGSVDEGQAIHEFGLRRAIRPNAALLTGYQMRNPRYIPRGGASLACKQDEEAGSHQRGMFTPVALRPGELEFHQCLPRADRDSAADNRSSVESRQARTMLDQLRRDAYLGEGESGVWRLAPGHTFRLDGHPLHRLNDEYVVTEVEHSGRSSMVREGKAGYRNHFRCVPATVRYRPPLPPRRMVQVAETATVVGPENEEIYTDELGRIRVRFHWDLAEGVQESSSCWMRVAQPWAGAGLGQQFIPRVGSEVLVVFLGGDPDAPLVTGSAYNGASPTPFQIPQDKSRSGFRTASTPGGMGYNEISFQDQAGQEEIFLRAERNLVEEVRSDRLVHVGYNQVETVDGVRTEVTKGGRFETVLGMSASEVLLGRVDAVGGMHQTLVRGDRTATVEGAESRTIQGDQTLRVRGDRAVWVNGILSTQVGTSEKPAEMQVTVLGRHSTSATESLSLHSEQQIVLECGESRVVIGPEEVRIESKQIVVNGKESALVAAAGPALKLTDQAQLTGQAVNLSSQGASLELTSIANLAGAQVNLNCGGGGGSAGADGKGPKLKPVKLKLHDEVMTPYANKHYRLMAGGMRYEGSTDGGGGLSEQVPEDAKVGQLTLWPDEYPAGSTLDWTVALAEEAVPPPADPAGALYRLHSLGYFEGEVTGTITPEAEAALRWFQEDYQLPVTGKLDSATVAKLKETQGT